jgi:ribosome-associated protein
MDERGDLRIDDRTTLPVSELRWTAARAGGPGGQNVNKVASKVELRFDLPATRALDEGQKARLRARCASRLDAEGMLVVTSQRTRDQVRNLADARAKLAALVAAALRPPPPRRPTQPTRASHERRLRDKRARADRKRSRAGADD